MLPGNSVVTSIMYRTAIVRISDDLSERCVSPSDLAIHVDDECIIEFDGILDHGHVASIAEMQGDVPQDLLPKLVRRATLQDQAKIKENALRSKMAADRVSMKVAEQDLTVHLVDVKYSFDMALLRVCFTSDDRIDLYDVISELSNELHARIVIKQIGVRDEAAIVGGMGPCGRRLCCCSWLSDFKSINVKMARAQRMAVNPGAITGMCARLKCCLRYEYDCYTELGNQLPRDGAHVECPDGCGRVVDKNILAQRIKVRMEDDRLLEYGPEEVRVARSAERTKNTGAERPESRPAGDS